MPDVGRVLGGRYRLLELLGEGGMATIYRGHDSQLDRDVAVKVLLPQYGRDASFITRFRQEAQAAASLGHPNVVAVYDYGTDEVGPFIVMELIDGQDLADLLRERGRVPPIVAARIALQIADALAAAHDRGIVHRDVKPSNVLVTQDGRVKVVDFGIARAFSESQLTLPGTTLGSVHYFSPEQARGEPVTAASDIYSLGLVLYEMLTGRRAWGGETAGAVALARLSGRVPHPIDVLPEVPTELDAIVARALALDPADRYASARELAADLEGVVQRATGAAPWRAGQAPATGVAAIPTGAGAAGDGAALPALGAELPALPAQGAAETGGPGGAGADTSGAPPGPAPGQAAAQAAPSQGRPPAGQVPGSGAPAAGTAPGRAAGAGGAPGVGVATSQPGRPARGLAGPPGQRPPAPAPARAERAESGGAGSGGRPPGPPDDEEEGGGLGIWAWAAGILGIVVLLLAGATIALFLSHGLGAIPSATPASVPLPNFVGSSLQAAQQKGVGLGLDVVIGQTQQSTAQPENTVVAQDQKPGTLVPVGSTVKVTIVTGAPLAKVPDLTHQTVANAVYLLYQNQLKPGSQTQAYDPVVPSGQVLTQSIPAGTMVPAGTSVDFVVSQGPAPSPSAQPSVPSAPPSSVSPSTPPPPTPTPEITPPPATPTPPPPPTPTPLPPSAPPTASLSGLELAPG